MTRKLRRWTVCATLVAAITMTPIVAGCVPVRPQRAIRVASYNIFVTSLEPQVVSDSER
jgi:hypothetical protein